MATRRRTTDRRRRPSSERTPSHYVCIMLTYARARVAWPVHYSDKMSSSKQLRCELSSNSLDTVLSFARFVSGAGTNLKVGAHVRRQAPEFFVVSLHFFGSTSTISRFGERFRDGKHSLFSFLFAVILLTVPPCQAICKSGSRCPRAPWSRRHCVLYIVTTFFDITNSPERHC